MFTNNLFCKLSQKYVLTEFSWCTASAVRTSKGHFIVTNLSVTRDQWPVTSDQWSVTSDQWPVTSDQWPVTSDQWPVTSDQWPVTSDQWPVTSDQWPVTSDQWPVTSDQWPVTSDQYFRPAAPVQTYFSNYFSYAYVYACAHAYVKVWTSPSQESRKRFNFTIPIHLRWFPGNRTRHRFPMKFGMVS